MCEWGTNHKRFWYNALMQTIMTPIDQLKFASYNPRKLSQKEFEELQRSIDEFGFVEPVICNRRGNVIISGHQRTRAAQALGMTEVPVVWVDLDEQREKALNIAMNAIGGEFDNDQLAELINTLDEDMQILTGFDEDEIEHLQDGWVKDVEAPEPPEKDKTANGTPRYDITLLRQLCEAWGGDDGGFIDWLASRE